MYVYCDLKVPVPKLLMHRKHLKYLIFTPRLYCDAKITATKTSDTCYRSVNQESISSPHDTVRNLIKTGQRRITCTGQRLKITNLVGFRVPAAPGN